MNRAVQEVRNTLGVEYDGVHSVHIAAVPVAPNELLSQAAFLRPKTLPETCLTLVTTLLWLGNLLCDTVGQLAFKAASIRARSISVCGMDAVPCNGSSAFHRSA